MSCSLSRSSRPEGVFDSIADIGAEFGLQYAGLRALGSLRNEKHVSDHGQLEDHATTVSYAPHSNHLYVNLFYLTGSGYRDYGQRHGQYGYALECGLQFNL
jgi:glycine cleavage system aminomethyltransferase T